MNISAKLAVIIAALFAAACGAVAITGFASLGDITDPAQLSDARGFAWFWTFLAAVGIAFGVVSWWIMRGEE